MEDEFGLIVSPDIDSDGKYDFNVNCSWTVQVKRNNSIIEFQVMFIEIARSKGCKDDKLEVFLTHSLRFYLDIS